VWDSLMLSAAFDGLEYDRQQDGLQQPGQEDILK
jgi:hypothetical protein